ncbi:unnamed protein product [Amoebophrya sp. A120]|nr:unnamed protein product [Amoebophrya sp. A120]|eukprot:GSA120T00013563001.1
MEDAAKPTSFAAKKIGQLSHYNKAAEADFLDARALHLSLKASVLVSFNDLEAAKETVADELKRRTLQVPGARQRKATSFRLVLQKSDAGLPPRAGQVLRRGCELPPVHSLIRGRFPACRPGRQPGHRRPISPPYIALLRLILTKKKNRIACAAVS